MAIGNGAESHAWPVLCSVSTPIGEIYEPLHLCLIPILIKIIINIIMIKILQVSLLPLEYKVY